MYEIAHKSKHAENEWTFHNEEKLSAGEKKNLTIQHLFSTISNSMKRISKLKEWKEYNEMMFDMHIEFAFGTS